MKAIFKPSVLNGAVDAPPSKSMSHRYLIGAALSGEKCTLMGMGYSEDILASIDCLRALGASVTRDGETVTVEPQSFMQGEAEPLDCRESGSTLRFFMPLALCCGRRITLRGSKRLFERPLSVYEELCRENDFEFIKDDRSVTVCGRLESGGYTVRGDVSSQFITGLIFALVYLNEESSIEIIPPFESKPYVHMTVSALRAFGADVTFDGEYKINIRQTRMRGCSKRIEGDYSNSAFLDAFNYVGSSVRVNNLLSNSLQGDKVYGELFEKISSGAPTVDISDCPDLAPVLFALAALKNGAVFTGTDRLRIKECDRGKAMHEELSKLGGGLIFGGNSITVPKQELSYKGMALDGHNDHRIVMASSVMLAKLGGEIGGIEAVRKSYPDFFEVIKGLGARVELI